jgi:hypothetical protein
MATWQPIAATLDHSGIISSYKSGEASADIASRLGVGKHIIYKILKKNKIELVNTRFSRDYKPHNLAVVDIDVLRSLCDEGLHVAAIAATMKLYQTVIRKAMKSHNLKRNPPRFQLPTNIRQIIGELAFAKLSDKEWLQDQYNNKCRSTRSIASELGCSKKAVGSFLRRHHLPLKRTNKSVFVSSNGKAKTFWCDSEWEMMIARRLEGDVKVIKYIKEPFPLVYHMPDGTAKNYYPDFMVFTTDDIYLVEIKPDGLLPYVELKTQAGYNSGFKYSVMNVDDHFPWYKI